MTKTKTKRNPSPIITPQRFRARIVQIDKQEDKKRGRAGVAKGDVLSTYSSGNIPIKQGWESTSTASSKTHKVTQMPSNRNGALAANNPMTYWNDADGNKGVLGKLVDVANLVVDADYFLGTRPATPGNTVLHSYAPELTTNLDSFTDMKSFQQYNGGKYRIKGKLSRGGGIARFRVVMLRLDGSKIPVTSEVTYNSTVHPTYGSEFQLDMTLTGSLGGFLLIVQLMNDIAGEDAYVSDLSICYADASASLTPYNVVL